MAFHGILVSLDSAYGPSGPGDTLRFVHAVRAYLDDEPQDQVRIVTTIKSLPLVRGMFSGVEQDIRQGGIWHEVDDAPALWLGSAIADKAAYLRWDQTDASQVAALLNDVAGAINVGRLDKVVHPYMGYGLSDFPATISVAGTDVTRLRIDKPSRMNRSRWRVPAGLGRADEGPTAVFLRHLDHRLDTPKVLVEAIRTAADQQGVGLVFFGGNDDTYDFFDVPEDARRYHQGKSYLEQMRSLATECVAAVGVNSGGLDLATAAGLPTLRVAEYQDGGYWYVDRELGGWLWRDYNWYLANAFVAGLQPPYNHADWWGDDYLAKVRLSLTAFFTMVQSNHPRLREPRHIIVPRDMSLDVAKLDSQLDRFEVIPEKSHEAT